MSMGSGAPGGPHGEQAAGKRGRPAQAGASQARRAERLVKLGFSDLAAYVQHRYVEQGSSVRLMQAELGVGRRWLDAELARLGSGADAGHERRPTAARRGR